MKYYRIRMKEVCALLGVSPQTIRNYEKANLSFGSKDKESGYRSYNVRHLLKLYEIRCLRQMGISIRELGDLCGKSTQVGELRAALERNMVQMDRQARLGMALRACSAELLRSLKEVEDQENPFLFCMRPGFYRLDCHRNGQIRTDAQSQALMQEWSALSPLTQYAPFVPRTQVQDEFIQIGLAVREESIDFLSAKDSPLIQYYPPCPCLRCTVVVNPQTWGYHSVIAPGMAYLEKHGFVLNGDVLAVAFAAELVTSGQPQGADYYHAYLPYREAKDCENK